MLKGLGNMASILKQAQQMGGKMQEINDDLKAKRVTGSAGAGLIEVEVNGAGELLRLKIDPSLIEKADQEMIEDLVPAAVNQALAKAKQLHADALQSMTSGLNLPGLNDAMQQFMASEPDEG